MSLPVLLSAMASSLLLPPVSPLLLYLAGRWLRRRAPRSGLALMLLGMMILLVLSTRVGALWTVRPLEDQYPPLTSPGDAQAIVILGSGRVDRAPEYGGSDDATALGMKRLQYGAYLARQTGLPILVTGGSPDGSPESEAALMTRDLQRDFGVAVRWQEQQADTTAQNASHSAAMLKADGITRILLVTDSIHMPRAMRVFTQTGLQVRAAPTLFHGRSRPRPTDYLPRASNLELASYALRERIGLWWYRFRSALEQ
ncbi:YdcF family protein [uncultured Herbaspirillum sp.]|uniref:YdcF family protein n=1 Tax=uncultured Herbaspirillum sp. TaxID=160236 RepID=UPI002609B7F3|nr:YdcF family protein [uncultured Herbaspirillum sp.]